MALTDHIGWSIILQLLDHMSQARWWKPDSSWEWISIVFPWVKREHHRGHHGNQRFIHFRGYNPYVYNLHCLLVLGSKGRWWFQRTSLYLPRRLTRIFFRTGGRYQLFLLKRFLSLRKPPTDAYLKMKVWQRYIIPKKFLASMSNMYIYIYNIYIIYI